MFSVESEVGYVAIFSIELNVKMLSSEMKCVMLLSSVDSQVWYVATFSRMCAMLLSYVEIGVFFVTVCSRKQSV